MEPLVPYFPLFFRGFVHCGLKTDLQILTPEKSEKKNKKGDIHQRLYNYLHFVTAINWDMFEDQ